MIAERLPRWLLLLLESSVVPGAKVRTLLWKEWLWSSS